MHLIDTHAHLNDRKYSGDLDAVIERANQAGVTRIVVCGYDLASSESAVSMAGRFESIYATVGVHPHDAKTYDASTERRIRELSVGTRVMAVGEIGLDFHYDFSPRDAQFAAFRAQVALAVELRLPIVVHSRKSNPEALQVLREDAANIVGCVFHCFSGDEHFAREVLDMGCYIGVDGPITYKSAGKLARVVRMCPIDRLLIETDCPYLTPVPHRGERNEPAYVRYVAEAVASIKGETVARIAEITLQNAETLFSKMR